MNQSDLQKYQFLVDEIFRTKQLISDYEYKKNDKFSVSTINGKPHLRTPPPLTLQDQLSIDREITSQREKLYAYEQELQALGATEDLEVQPTPVTHDAPTGIDGAPPMQKGKNSRKNVEAWVQFQAAALKRDGDNIPDLAKKIRLESERWGYESERTKLTNASITRMIPAGITGGRSKNRGKPKK